MPEPRDIGAVIPVARWMANQYAAQMGTEGRDAIHAVCDGLEQAQQQLKLLRENEHLMLRKLSEILSGGNAGTWEEIEQAVEAVRRDERARAVRICRTQAERYRREQAGPSEYYMAQATDACADTIACENERETSL